MNKFRKISLIPLMSFLIIQPVFASGETPVSDGLKYVIDAMYGETGYALATLSVILVGLLCVGHFCRWTSFLYTIIGISIIFGATPMVHGIVSLVH